MPPLLPKNPRLKPSDFFKRVLTYEKTAAKAADALASGIVFSLGLKPRYPLVMKI
jgi:hypothetical protein